MALTATSTTAVIILSHVNASTPARRKSRRTDLPMQNTSPDSSPKVSPAASTSNRGSDGNFEGGSPSHATLPQTLDMLVFEPDVDLVGPVSLDSGTSTPPPLAGPSSPKMPMPDVNNASGSKRKQVDDERATSEAEERPHDRKKLKEMHLNDGAPSPIIPRHMSDVAGAVNLELGRPRSPSLEDELSRLTSDSFESPSPFPEVPSTLRTIPAISVIPPARPHSAPPTSPIHVNSTTGAHPLPPQSSLPPDPEPLHTFSCSICFSSPVNATLTPCGHIMCGECLFTAVGAAAVRMGSASLAARCPVCRATIPKWDGRGGGVIGLQPRVVITI